MPFRVEVEPERQRGVGVMEGSVTGAVLMDAMRALFAHPLWQPGYDALWDGRGITELLLDASEVSQVVALTASLAPQIGTGRGAFVMSRETDHLMTTLMVYRSRTGERDRRVFQTMEEALAWLEQDPAPEV